MSRPKRGSLILATGYVGNDGVRDTVRQGRMTAAPFIISVGVPVVEGIGAPIRMAAMLAGLGLKHSRKRWPKSDARPNAG